MLARKEDFEALAVSAAFLAFSSSFSRLRRFEVRGDALDLFGRCIRHQAPHRAFDRLPIGHAGIHVGIHAPEAPPRDLVHENRIGVAVVDGDAVAQRIKRFDKRLHVQ
jgi:hypothetical protein